MQFVERIAVARRTRQFHSMQSDFSTLNRLRRLNELIEAFPILIGADASACDELIPFGDGKGKPLFISGPHDNVKRILATLNRTIGPGGYEYIVGGPDADDLPDEAIRVLDGLDDTCFDETKDPA